MMISFHDIALVAPISIVSLTALVVLVIESLSDKTERLNCWIAILGLIAAMVAAVSSLPDPGTAFSGMVTTGGFSAFFSLLFCVAGLLTIMISESYIRKESIEHGEYYSLLLFAVVGMMLMAAAADLIILFLGLETMSIAFYVMAGFARTRQRSNEAALKYFLLGAFATGFLLYGIALVYGSTSSTAIATIVAHASNVPDSMFLIGLGLILVGLAFKIAAVPFHMWVPDVYEGSPTPVSGFMSTGGKAAAFAGFLLIFAPHLIGSMESVRDILAGVAALSMVVGNVIAIAQTSIKRMLAYSSIAHAGYILVGVIAANTYGSNGVMFYLLAYTLMNIGAFGIVALFESEGGTHVTFDDYAGASSKYPILAGLMALFMFSLSGIPPFAGFFGKYYVFAGAVQAGYTWLTILGVLMSVVSAYYYLRLVVLMYFKEQPTTLNAPKTILGYMALVLAALALVGFGIFPDTILSVTTHFF